MRKILARIAVAIGLALLLALGAFAFVKVHYFDSKNLDPRPYPVHGLTFTPPKSRNGIDYFGKLRLDIYIREDGTVDHVDMLDSTVPLGLRDDAVAAFSKVAWEPGRLWSMRVKSVKRIELELTPPPGMQLSPTQ